MCNYLDNIMFKPCLSNSIYTQLSYGIVSSMITHLYLDYNATLVNSYNDIASRTLFRAALELRSFDRYYHV